MANQILCISGLTLGWLKSQNWCLHCTTTVPITALNNWCRDEVGGCPLVLLNQLCMCTASGSGGVHVLRLRLEGKHRQQGLLLFGLWLLHFAPVMRLSIVILRTGSESSHSLYKQKAMDTNKTSLAIDKGMSFTNSPTNIVMKLCGIQSVQSLLLRRKNVCLS